MGGGTGGGEFGVCPLGELVGGVDWGGGTLKLPPFGGSGMSIGWSAGDWGAGGRSGRGGNGCGV